MLGNRDTKGVSKIVESIQAVGQVEAPIIVNEKLEVIDGQNRLEAYEQLSLPVYYIQLPGLDINTCRRLNIGQTNWGNEDYIASYAEEGNESYKRLASLLNTYKKSFKLEGLLALANPLTINDSGARARSLIKPGKYTLSQKEYEQAVRRLSSAEELGYVDFCKRKKYSARIYWAAVAYIYLNPSISASEAANKLFEYETIVPGSTSVSEQLRFFEDAINRGKREKSKVRLYADFMRREYMGEDNAQ